MLWLVVEAVIDLDMVAGFYVALSRFIAGNFPFFSLHLILTAYLFIDDLSLLHFVVWINSVFVLFTLTSPPQRDYLIKRDQF